MGASRGVDTTVRLPELADIAEAGGTISDREEFLHRQRLWGGAGTPQHTLVKIIFLGIACGAIFVSVSIAVICYILSQDES